MSIPFSIPIPSKNSTVVAVVAGVVVAPLFLASVLPYLRTQRPPQQPQKLPSGVTRTSTVSGLELLVSKPAQGSNKSLEAPLLLIHGGYGTALCYSKWLPYLAQKGRLVYSMSLAGHGQSPRPPNFVSLKVGDFARDVEEVIEHICNLHPERPPPVLIGHSSGGGLSQYVLSSTKKDKLASGIIPVASIPPTGGWKVHGNWILHDPLFCFRIIVQGGDPKGPLSSPSLVQSVFFGPKMQKQELMEFYENMNPEESLGWPTSMMMPFVDVKKVKEHVNGNVAWIGGEKDVLVSPQITKAAAEAYQTSSTIIPLAGHHLMRDEMWQEGADLVLAQLQAWSL